MNRQGRVSELRKHLLNRCFCLMITNLTWWTTHMVVCFLAEFKLICHVKQWWGYCSIFLNHDAQFGASNAWNITPMSDQLQGDPGKMYVQMCYFLVTHDLFARWKHLKSEQVQLRNKKQVFNVRINIWYQRRHSGAPIPVCCLSNTHHAGPVNTHFQNSGCKFVAILCIMCNLCLQAGSCEDILCGNVIPRNGITVPNASLNTWGFVKPMFWQILQLNTNNVFGTQTSYLLCKL